MKPNVIFYYNCSFFESIAASRMGDETWPEGSGLLRGSQHPANNLATAQHRQTPQLCQLARRKSSGKVQIIPLVWHLLTSGGLLLLEINWKKSIPLITILVSGSSNEKSTILVSRPTSISTWGSRCGSSTPRCTNGSATTDRHCSTGHRGSPSACGSCFFDASNTKATCHSYAINHRKRFCGNFDSPGSRSHPRPWCRSTWTLAWRVGEADGAQRTSLFRQSQEQNDAVGRSPNSGPDQRRATASWLGNEVDWRQGALLCRPQHANNHISGPQAWRGPHRRG